MPRIPEGKKGCVLVRPLEKCCPHYKCGNIIKYLIIQIEINWRTSYSIVDDNDASVIEQVSKDTICRVKDKEYTVGQYIQSGDPCLSCRCVEDFNGLVSYFSLHQLIDHKLKTKLNNLNY